MPVFVRLLILLLLAIMPSAAQMQQMNLRFTKGQTIDVAVRLEAGSERTGHILMTVDSIDAEQNVHFIIKPAEAVTATDTMSGKIGGRRAYLGGATVSVYLTPRGEVLFKDVIDKQLTKWMQGIKADSVYNALWDNQSVTTSYQFLFPSMAKVSDIKEALGAFKKKNLCSFSSDNHNKDLDPESYTSTCRTLETKFTKGKPVKIKGEKFYDITREEIEETDHGGGEKVKPYSTHLTRTTVWTLRESDGVILKENMTSFMESSLGAMQSLSRIFDAGGNKAK